MIPWIKVDRDGTQHIVPMYDFILEDMIKDFFIYDLTSISKEIVNPLDKYDKSLMAVIIMIDNGSKNI